MSSRKLFSINYRFFNEMSTASELEILHERQRKKYKKDVYQAEEVLAEKKVSCYLLWLLLLLLTVDRLM